MKGGRGQVRDGANGGENDGLDKVERMGKMAAKDGKREAGRRER